MRKKGLTIALDGHSSCGKSTFAKQIAAKLGYIYIDSGAMYRSVTLYALQKGIISNKQIDEKRLKDELKNIHIEFSFKPEIHQSITFLNGVNVEEQIRSQEVAAFVSPISKIKFVREKMVEIQREIGKDGGIVMDGRDIGTVVFPDAELKIFLTAQPDVRAMRRYMELKAKGKEIAIEEVKKNLLERDHIDSTRAESPLKRADDALELDNSNMTPAEQMIWVWEVIDKIMKK
jgi:CMP/dCMP kinase